jgi:intracellular sulfur oxidation DsrE/DsrF family protein
MDPSRRRVLAAGGLAAGSSLVGSRRAEGQPPTAPSTTGPTTGSTTGSTTGPTTGPTTTDDLRVDPDRPFVEHRLALQLSDRAEDKQALILSVSYNMLKAYGPDVIAIEVVAFGPGIDLLRAGSSHRVKVDSLVAQGVRFSVCMNTVETIERETGAPVALNPKARKVQAGVARILALCEAGYTLVRP